MVATAANALVRGISRLRRNSDAPRTDAMLLLARALRRPRAWILAHDDAAISDADVAAFDAMCDARATGMPLAYVLGEAGFYGRTFTVDERVLVPRPETERLVEDALAHLRRRQQPPNVLDVGTGSGAIACTIAAELPVATVAGTDASEDALEVARGNARLLQVAQRCSFGCGDLADPVKDARFDAILANLPYVPTDEVPRAPDPVGFEPRAALDGGLDGLALYRRFLASVSPLLRPGALLLMEAAPQQIARLHALAVQALPGTSVGTGRDFGGAERFVRVEVASP